MSQAWFLEPLDVLVLRGNRLFGDPGSYGEALMPPWPSVAAGAIRSLWLLRAGIDLAQFAAGEASHPALGSRDQPGNFRVTDFCLARRVGDKVESLRPMPADLVVEDRDGEPVVRRLLPVGLAEGIACSAPLPAVAALRSDYRVKPLSGYWLRQAGWEQYLNGRTPEFADLVHSDSLWAVDFRVGVGLDRARRRAGDGQLFSLQAVALKPGVGFLLKLAGQGAPAEGVVRLGGDGRAARLSLVAHSAPAPDTEAIAESGRCRVVLTTPGIFPTGWRLPGANTNGQLALGDLRATLRCAALPRAAVVSGWDMAHRQPKPAQRCVPAGSVYWLENITGDAAPLRKLAAGGWWPENDYDANRRAEGFNCFALARETAGEKHV